MIVGVDCDIGNACGSDAVLCIEIQLGAPFSEQ